MRRVIRWVCGLLAEILLLSIAVAGGTVGAVALAAWWGAR